MDFTKRAVLRNIVMCMIVLSASVSCGQGNSLKELTFASSDIIIPRPGPGIDLFAPESGENDAEVLSLDTQLLKVAIDSEYIAHQVSNFSLDQDSPEEQVIAFKYREGQNDKIGLLVSDYDPLRDGYFISWQGMTLATSLKTFRQYTEDITGDRRPELVVFGTNNQGEQTLDIFKQENSSSYGIQLRNILSIDADIESVINVVERSEYYNSGVNIGNPFTISSFTQDLESENRLDMVRSVYTWRTGERRYLLSQSEKIPGSRVEQDQLSELYAGNLSDYHQFIEGPWISEDGERLLLFSRSTDSIQLATDDRQINFHWIESSPFAFGSSIRIQLQNEILSTEVYSATVSVLALNTMVIQIRNIKRSIEDGIKFWSGPYKRYQKGIASLNTGSGRDKILYPFEISGLYRSDNSWEMFFSVPQITLRTTEEEKSGGYAIFTLNDISILEINFTDALMVTPEKWHFLVEYEEYVEDEQLHRLLHLREASLNSYGAIPVSNEIIKLEQIINLDDQN